MLPQPLRRLLVLLTPALVIPDNWGRKENKSMEMIAPFNPVNVSLSERPAEMRRDNRPASRVITVPAQMLLHQSAHGEENGKHGKGHQAHPPDMRANLASGSTGMIVTYFLEFPKDSESDRIAKELAQIRLTGHHRVPLDPVRSSAARPRHPGVMVLSEDRAQMSLCGIRERVAR